MLAVSCRGRCRRVSLVFNATEQRNDVVIWGLSRALPLFRV